VITDQPLPQVVFKGKQIEEPYTVSLLTGASRNFDEVSDSFKRFFSHYSIIFTSNCNSIEHDLPPLFCLVGLIYSLVK
jgi:hypothetical protein